MAGGSLRTYRAKRDFGMTPEPKGARSRTGAALQFVVQKHHARRLHYDFRLELDGTLKSWAVPKGPSLDPAQKRLAVHVEDHPLDYAGFEGTIPEGQYGAGEVIVWDRGTWIPAGNPRRDYAAGKLKFRLRGEKLRGAWTLVRTRLPGSGGKEQWLLIKERDESARDHAEFDVAAQQPDSVKSKRASGSARGGKSPAVDAAVVVATRKAALPLKLAPQLATLVKAPPQGDEWSCEIKFDGYRLLARRAGKRVQLFTRNGKDWTAKLPHLRDALAQLPAGDGWFDGEIVVAGGQGLPDFQALQNAFDSEQTAGIHYFLFDLPFHGGRDLRAAPLQERRRLLRALLAGDTSGVLHFSETLEGSPQDLLASACAQHMEGVIGKRRDAAYSSGRNTDWIKLKCENRQEFVIGGFTDPQRSRSGLGALLLGVNDHGILRYAGRTGTGFDEKQLLALRRRLDALEQAKPAFANPPGGAGARGVHWVKPVLVAEVSFAQWTQDRVVRQAVFHGLRSDKPASKIGYEKALAAPRKAAAVAAKAAKPATREAGGGLVAGVAITHPDRIIDPHSGRTKLDVARYYEEMAPFILRHLRARPVSLVRLPEGLGGEQFFQKHVDRRLIRHARILPRSLDPGHEPLMALESAQALAGAAQMGAIEFHTWNALATSIGKPDRLVLDLDPDVKLGWTRVIEAAELAHVLLDELGVKSFAKTSGGRGIHIVIPLRRVHDWDTVKEFSRRVAEHLAATLPDRFSAKMGPKNRVGKVFVDYLRNNRGSTTVSAYSLRARPGLPVSVPIAWEELVEIAKPDQWNIDTVRQRLADLPADPWKDYEKSRQSIRKAIDKLKRQEKGSRERLKVKG